MTKVHIGPDAIIIWDFNTPLSNLDRSSKLKTSKENSDMNALRMNWI